MWTKLSELPTMAAEKDCIPTSPGDLKIMTQFLQEDIKVKYLPYHSSIKDKKVYPCPVVSCQAPGAASVNHDIALAHAHKEHTPMGDTVSLVQV